MPTTVPFTMAEPHMLVEVRVDDDEVPLRFLFDTGATGTIIDVAEARRLRLEPTGAKGATGAAGKAQLRVTNGRRLRLHGGVVLADIALLQLDLAHLSVAFDLP